MKPLQKQIDDTKKLISNEMSNYKTSCKQFMNFLKCFKEIEQNYIKEINILRITGGKSQLYSNKSFNKLTDYENQTIIDVVNNSQSYLISMEDIHQQLVNDIENKMMKDLNKQYHFQKKSKQNYLENIKFLNKKRDDFYQDQSNIYLKDEQNDDFNSGIIQELQNLIVKMQEQNSNRTNSILANMIQMQSSIQKKQEGISLRTKQTFDFIQRVEINLEDDKIEFFKKRLKDQQLQFQTQKKQKKLYEIQKKNSQSQSQYNSYNSYKSNDYQEYSQKLSDVDLIKIKIDDKDSIYNEMLNRTWFKQQFIIIPAPPKIKQTILEQEWYKQSEEYINKKNPLFPKHLSNLVNLGNMQKHSINIFIYFFYQRYIYLHQYNYDQQDLDYLNQYIWNKLRQKDLYKKKISIAILPRNYKNNNMGVDYILQQIKNPIEKNDQSAQDVSKTFLIMLVLNQFWYLEENNMYQNYNQDILQTLKFYDEEYDQDIYDKLSNQFILTQIQLELSFNYKVNIVQMIYSQIFDNKDQNQNFLYDFRFNDCCQMFFQVSEKTFGIDSSILIAMFLQKALQHYIKSNIVFNPQTAFKYIIELDSLFTELDIHKQQQQQIDEQFSDKCNLIKLYKIKIFQEIFKDISQIIRNINTIKKDNEQLMSGISRIYIFSFNNLSPYLQESELKLTTLQRVQAELEVCAQQIIERSSQKYKIQFDNNEHQNIFLDTLFQMLNHINSEVQFIKEFIIVFASQLSKSEIIQYSHQEEGIQEVDEDNYQKQKESQTQYQKKLALAFFKHLTQELRQFCEFYSSKISLIHNETSRMFNIAFELSNLDQFIFELTNDSSQEVMLESIGPAIELWVQQVQHENKQIVEKCSYQDTFILNDKQDCSDQTVEFCGLVFKSFEIIKEIIVKNKNQKFRMLIQKRVEIIIHESILDFIKKIHQSALLFHQDRHIEFKYQDKSYFFNKVINFVNNHSIMVNNFGQIKKIQQKMKNLDFIYKQIYILKRVLQNKSFIIEDIKEDIFTINLQVYSIMSYLIVIEHFKPIFFDKLYLQIDFNEIKQQGVLNYSENHENSFNKLLPEIEDYLYYLSLIQTDIINDNQEQHIQVFIDVFCKRFMVEAFHHDKFKNVRDQNKLAEYLKNELDHFFERFCIILKMNSDQIYIKNSCSYYQTIIDYYQIPTEVLLQKLVSMALNEDKLHINIALRILFMRNKHSMQYDKAINQELQNYQEFFK